MMIRRFVHTLPVSLAILRTAAWLVPVHQREEWFSEWSAELWHVWHTRNENSVGTMSGRNDATAFCLGAFQDALWLRRNDLGPAHDSVPVATSSRYDVGPVSSRLSVAMRRRFSNSGCAHNVAGILLARCSQSDSSNSVWERAAARVDCTQWLRLGTAAHDTSLGICIVDSKYAPIVS